MRDVRPSITAAWQSGDFTGSRRPIARVTVQQAKITLHDVGFNVYASLPFGADQPPRELPNVRQVSWQRSTETEVASCDLEFYNVRALPLGTIGSYDRERPGYFSFRHGMTAFSERWGHRPHEWSTLIVPDNLIRTYEGYGFDPDVIPELDPHLEQTGLWMIDEVSYGTDGMIRVQCRDIGRILADQIVFPGVVPPAFYPLSFSRSTTKPGIQPGRTETKVVTTGGEYDEKHPPPPSWTGPTWAPEIAGLESGDRKATVRVSPPDYQFGNAYAITGYQAVVDGVRLPAIYRIPEPRALLDARAAEDAAGRALAKVQVGGTEAHRRAIESARVAVVHRENQLAQTRKGTPEHQAALVQLNEAKAAYQQATDKATGPYKTALKAEDAARNRRIELQNDYNATSATFTIDGLTNGNVYLVEFCAIYQATGATGKAGAGHVLAGDRSNELWARPSSGGTADIAPDSLKVDTDADGNQNLGETHPGMLAWRYRGTGQPISWRVVYYRTVNGRYERQVEYYDSAPTPNGSAQVAAFQTPRTKPRNRLTDWNVLVYGYGARAFGGEHVVGAGAVHFRSTGGAGEFYMPPVAGAPPQSAGRLTGTTSPVTFTVDSSSSATVAHPAVAAFDDPGSFWQSAGHDSPSGRQDMEWVQATAKGETLVGVRFSTKGTGYQAFISVFAHGTWIKFGAHDDIPYTADADVDNGARIPYVHVTAALQHEGPHVVTFRHPIPGVTKVRVTLRNLQRLDGAYRAAIRSISGVSGAVTPGTGPIQDTTGPTTASTYTTTIPPKVVPGAGQTPGKYYDYTEIIKLFCAWAGFFWPRNARVLRSDGVAETVTYPNTAGTFGLANIDPVLGENAGRVWGDFEDTGTGGVSDLGVETWDKKTLIDGISYVREILGHLFYIDETGGAVWKMPNIFRVGNDVGTLSRNPRRVQEYVVLDEKTVLLSAATQLRSRNIRERIFISNTDGTAAAVAQGYNPNPIGLRRVGGWTDQNFKSDKEALRMADRIALAGLLTHRESSLVIPAYPRIQIDDQVRVYEEITNDGYLHYVKSISSTNNAETGEWTYELGTQWLGTHPFELWVFHPDNLSDELRRTLAEIGILPPRPVPAKPKSGAINDKGIKVSMYVRVDGNPQVYITDGITRRPVRDEAERIALAAAGLVPTPKVQIVSQTLMDRIPVVAEDKSGL